MPLRRTLDPTAEQFGHSESVAERVYARSDGASQNLINNKRLCMRWWAFIDGASHPELPALSSPVF